MQRFWPGVGWGVVATVAMSAVMILGTASGLSPMPAPIPAAIVQRIFGEGLARPALMGIAAILHLVYGGMYGWLMDRGVAVDSGLEA